ncbi:MAG: hypothetical protein ACK4IS_09555 [Erythrobacter sp.]
MIAASQPLPPAASPASGAPAGWANAPAGWAKLRASGDIQFEPVALPEVAPRELGAFERFLQGLFRWLGEVLGPVGAWLGAWWWLIEWVLIAGVAGFVLILLARTFGPLARRRNARTASAAVPWRPDTAASLALIEDAERLAAEGRFDEATHLLLTRSVGELAAARPGVVEPSSTARELAALPALSDAAREAFRVMAERVEISLFALQRLERADWEAARDAYARFALALPDKGAHR